MANLSISLTAGQLKRVRHAFGKMKFDPERMVPGEGDWEDASKEEVEAEIKKILKERVRGHEAQKAMNATSAAVVAETDW